MGRSRGPGLLAACRFAGDAELAGEGSLDRSAKRLLILLVARFGRPGSRSAGRAWLSAEEGLPEAQVRAISDGDLDSPAFAASERTLLALARRFLEAPRIESRFYD